MPGTPTEARIIKSIYAHLQRTNRSDGYLLYKEAVCRNLESKLELTRLIRSRACSSAFRLEDWPATVLQVVSDTRVNCVILSRRIFPNPV
eukprot:IDg19662t1